MESSFNLNNRDMPKEDELMGGEAVSLNLKKTSPINHEIAQLGINVEDKGLQSKFFSDQITRLRQEPIVNEKLISLYRECESDLKKIYYLDDLYKKSITLSSEETYGKNEKGEDFKIVTISHKAQSGRTEEHLQNIRKKRQILVNKVGILSNTIQRDYPEEFELIEKRILDDTENNTN